MNLGIGSIVNVMLFDFLGNLVGSYTCTNFLTELGEAYLADRLSDRNQADGDIDGMEIGKGTGQSRTSTGLATSLARVSATVAQGTGGDYNDVIYTATFGTSVPATDETITEGALFSNPTTLGTMINYFEFSPGIFKATTMTLVITVTFTVGAS